MINNKFALAFYNGRSPSFRIADTHEKDGFWIFAFAQDPLQKTIFLFFRKGGKSGVEHLVSSLKMRPPPAGTCDGRGRRPTHSPQTTVLIFTRGGYF